MHNNWYLRRVSLYTEILQPLNPVIRIITLDFSFIQLNLFFSPHVEFETSDEGGVKKRFERGIVVSPQHIRTSQYDN